MLADTLYKNIFERNGEVEDATEHLNSLVKKYPYFSLAHFYLLKKTAPTASNYPEIAAKTSLHFNNPFLLQQQLSDDGEYIDASHTDASSTEETPIAPQEIKQNEIIAQDEIAEASIKENFITPTAPDETDVIVHDQLPVTSTAEDFITPAAPVESEVIIQVDEPVTSAEIEMATTPVVPVTEPETAKTTALTAPATEKPAADEALLFEPLHASDYFASQGIKLRDEPLPNDKLGKQLKSFTDWLKTMKKVHETQGSGKELSVDVAIQQLAEKSNKEEAVITEAMAEVFLQQGKQHKAKEIYEKLSLLNPSKSAYFAAKLDQIQ